MTTAVNLSKPDSLTTNAEQCLRMYRRMLTIRHFRVAGERSLYPRFDARPGAPVHR